jgi:hypothetical protein
VATKPTQNGPGCLGVLHPPWRRSVTESVSAVLGRKCQGCVSAPVRVCRRSMSVSRGRVSVHMNALGEIAPKITGPNATRMLLEYYCVSAACSRWWWWCHENRILRLDALRRYSKLGERCESRKRFFCRSGGTVCLFEGSPRCIYLCPIMCLLYDDTSCSGNMSAAGLHDEGMMAIQGFQ